MLLQQQGEASKTDLFYDLLVRMVNRLGWDDFVALRKQVFLLQNEAPEAESKALINPWFDRLIMSLYDDLRVVQHMQGSFPRPEERNREEWQQLAQLCRRLLQPQLELQCLLQVRQRTVNPDKALLYRLAQLQGDPAPFRAWCEQHRHTDLTWQHRLGAMSF